MTIGTVGLVGLGLAGVFAVVDWIAVFRGDARLEQRAKPAVLAVLVVAVVLTDPDASPRSLLLATALATSLAGDWLLLPPERFAQGLLAFFVAHLAYLGAFLVGPIHPELALAGAIAAAAVLFVAGRGILAGATRAGMRRPVAGYLGAICLMAIAATASGLPLAVAGAWSFVASDAILGWDRFVAMPAGPPRSALVRRLAVIVPYHCGQLFLAAALLAAA